MRPGRVYSKQKEIRAELSARYPVSWSSVAPGLRGSLAPMGSLNWASGLNAKLHLTVSQSCCYGHFHLVLIALTLPMQPNSALIQHYLW